MWENGQNPYHVEDFLKTKGDEYLLSRPTLYKHYNYYKKATQRAEKTEKQTEEDEFIDNLEKELWNTIKSCRDRLDGESGKALSPKEWQYFDQQKQSAIEKLMKLREAKGSSADASIALSKFFSKFKIDKALAKEEQGEEDNGDDPGGNILPREPLPV